MKHDFFTNPDKYFKWELIGKTHYCKSKDGELQVEENNGKFFVRAIPVGFCQSLLSAVSNLEFDDKNSAAYIALTILRCHRDTVKNVPIDVKAYQAMVYQFQDLLKFERSLKEMASSLFYRKANLRQSCRNMGFDPDGDMTEELDDNKKLIKELDEFRTDGQPDAPFFSEATLYELLGKSDARSVLGLINTVKKKLDFVEGNA